MNHRLYRRTLLNTSLETTFSFFSQAENLENITPPELNFRILTPQPIEMKAGTLIDYQLRLFGARFQWKTEITHWNPPHGFTDEQLKGPYKKWVHHHRFTPQGDSTLMEDEVHYCLPLSPLGDLAYPMIAFQLRRIFDYRIKAIHDLIS